MAIYCKQKHATIGAAHRCDNCLCDILKPDPIALERFARDVLNPGVFGFAVPPRCATPPAWRSACQRSRPDNAAHAG